MVTDGLAVAGAVQAPVAATMAPALADQVTVPRAPPATVALKVVAELTARVAAAGLTAPMLTVWGVTVTEASAWLPAALRARSQ